MGVEKSSCGVGFLANRRNEASHEVLQRALGALRCVEHRGACGADALTGDGAGVMTDLPYELFNYPRESVAVAFLFLPRTTERATTALRIFTETFEFHDLHVLEIRDVPTNPAVLGEEARKLLPTMKQVVIKRPAHSRTLAAFNRLLYLAKQATAIRIRKLGFEGEFFFASLSATTIVYKALTPSDRLDRFYLDLQNPAYTTRFAVFHRRFSTNTRTTWDKAQPFRLIGHNGEINTIAGNRSWSFSREKSLGLQVGELLTHGGISDTGSMNEMTEALLYRSSIPNIEEVLAILMPPADRENQFYKFWGRALEPWDGPAIIIFSDGQKVGARLDRNGFRPARWAETEEFFFLGSEAGAFDLDDALVVRKGSLHAGTGVSLDLRDGTIDFRDPSIARDNLGVTFEPRLVRLPEAPCPPETNHLGKERLFAWTHEDVQKMLVPMATTGKEPIGSMGDTSCLAVLSDQPRSFFDFFYQDFAQVTNPPVDFLREAMVTDLTVYLGAKPNIFAPKELVPPSPAIELPRPLLSLGEMELLFGQIGALHREYGLGVAELDITFDRATGPTGLRDALDELTRQALIFAEHGMAVLILSDRRASRERPPIPSLLALRAVVNGLNEAGMKLDAALVVHSGEIRSSHHAAALVGFGATAVCPYLALDIARSESHAKLQGIPADAKERNFLDALETGLLKIMAKMGISVVRSYQNARLFTPVGLGKTLMDEFFPGMASPVGGLELGDIAERLVALPEEEDGAKLPHTFIYKESTNAAAGGERHSMTNARAKLIHRLVRETGVGTDSPALFDEYLKTGGDSEPVNLRHLFSLRKAAEPLPLDAVQSKASVMTTFGTGGMSFGAISAESQRDLVIAMRRTGGRSNSGEGGENPYYFSDGVTATIKQVASARFGVTAQYLISADEIQIKIAQGAKPGEGGQLMSPKVTDDIARARFAKPGIDLISPPPMHDIYSIEDLKELIYEFKQLHPTAKVSVKLVAGANIGTIAVGVAKAGADIIHVSGGDGGTGAAGLVSMRHAGLPWEIGLTEVHQALVENDLRAAVEVRVDGGMSTGRDVAIAAILGAEGVDFGKLLLVAQGCIMARICETNSCPAGIATHDPKWKKKYQGTPEQVVTMLEYLAEDVRRHLSAIGVATLGELLGRTDLLAVNPLHAELVASRKLRLEYFFDAFDGVVGKGKASPAAESLKSFGISPLNGKITADATGALLTADECTFEYAIRTTDRAVPATLAGVFAADAHRRHIAAGTGYSLEHKKAVLRFTGSAGQGFGVFLTEGIRLGLRGEANDSVCKGMSGGKVVIRPRLEAGFAPEENAIIGNCALYGATGGTLYVNGLAGDRFAVRNSGATAVVEGVGLHACEYMTGGTVVILGGTSKNLGAGMTGGVLYLAEVEPANINDQFLVPSPLGEADLDLLLELLADYVDETDSRTALAMLNNWTVWKRRFTRYDPKPKK